MSDFQSTKVMWAGVCNLLHAVSALFLLMVTPAALASGPSADSLERLHQKYHSTERIAAFGKHPEEFPHSGALILSLTEDSQLRALKVPVGSVVLAQGDARYLACCWPSPDGPLLQKINASERVLRWFSPEDGKEHTSQLRPGLMGAMNNGFRSLPNWFLHHGQRSERWDKLVYTALWAQGEDVPAAEACWEKALKAGYKPDRLSAWSTMMCGIAKGDGDQAERGALAFGVPKPPLKEDDFPLWAWDWQSLAYVTGKAIHLQEVMEAFKEFPGVSTVLPEEAERQLALEQAYPPPAESPLTLAAQRKRKPMLREMDPFAYSISKLHEMAAAVETLPDTTFQPLVFRNKPQEKFDFLNLAFPLDTKDVLLELECCLAPEPFLEGVKAKYGRIFEFHLSGVVRQPDQKVGEASSLIYTMLGFGNDREVHRNWFVEGWGRKKGTAECAWISQERLATQLAPAARPDFSLDPEAWHTVRLCKVGSRTEASIDGKRIALASAPLDAFKLRVHFHFFGTKLTVRAFRAFELVNPTASK
jgi:hypothetical protein